MIEVRVLDPREVAACIDALAALRIAVFHEWPYLYEGDLIYERAYLSPYVRNPAAMVVGAFDGPRLIGASTAMPLENLSGNIRAPFADRPEAPETIYYGGESIVLPDYRGCGLGTRFFDLREDRACALGRSRFAFVAIMRPANHPMRPPKVRGNEAFWTRRGYRPVPGAIAMQDWRDRGESQDTSHPLQFWMRTLA